MKKLLMSAIVLSCFAIAMSLFQMSCQKDAEAASSTTVQNKFLYIVGPSSSSSGTGVQYWIANIDGTNNQPINITLPSGQSLGYSCKLSPDAQKIIFFAWGGGNKYLLYSASLNGSNLTLLRELTSIQAEIGDSY